MEMREHILNEIRRIAREQGGVPPGRVRFEQETGIGESVWYGVIWARWNDAVAEAGFAPNNLQGKLPSDLVLSKYAEVCRYFGHVPSSGELRMYSRETVGFLSHNTFSKHFGRKEELIKALRHWAEKTKGNEDLLALLPEPTGSEGHAESPKPVNERPKEGYVYLLKSGNHYKIGRSDEIERRVKQITISLPEKVELIHTIRTDDPPGIEAYWHRRFAERRARGEWFKLTPSDVRAFKRRKYQ